MRQTYTWLLSSLLLLVACKQESPPPTPVVLDVPAPRVRFVHASTLKLRQEPSAAARVIGRVGVNSPLKVLEERSGFSRVEVKNAKVGWVASRYLDDTRLTVELALARARSADAPDAKLSWLQRAAALEPTHVEVLRELQGAYTAAGKADEADTVGQLVVRLVEAERAAQGRMLGVRLGGIEWQTLGHVDESVLGDVPREQWDQLGITGDEELWLLPVDRPAERVHIRSVAREMWSECAGVAGVAAYVEGEGVLAFHGKAPASWSVVPKTWDAERLAVLEARLRAKLCDRGASCKVAMASAVGHGAFARVISNRGPVEPGSDFVTLRFVDVRIADDDPSRAALQIVDDQILEHLGGSLRPRSPCGTCSATRSPRCCSRMVAKLR